MANADQTPVFFNMPSNVTVDRNGAKSVIIKSTGNEKSCITVMLGVTANRRKLPPYVILKRKMLPQEQLPAGIVLEDRKWGG